MCCRCDACALIIIMASQYTPLAFTSMLQILIKDQHSMGICHYNGIYKVESNIQGIRTQTRRKFVTAHVDHIKQYGNVPKMQRWPDTRYGMWTRF